MYTSARGKHLAGTELETFVRLDKLCQNLANGDA